MKTKNKIDLIKPKSGAPSNLPDSRWSRFCHAFRMLSRMYHELKFVCSDYIFIYLIFLWQAHCFSPLFIALVSSFDRPDSDAVFFMIAVQRFNSVSRNLRGRLHGVRVIRRLPFPQQGCLSVSVHLNLAKIQNTWKNKNKKTGGSQKEARGSRLVALARRLAY